MKRRELLITTGGVAAAAFASATAPWLWHRARAKAQTDSTKVWFTHSMLPSRGRVANDILINSPGFVGCADVKSGQCLLLDVPLFGHEVVQSPIDPAILFTSEKWGAVAAIIDFEKRKVIAKIQNEKGRRFFGHAQFALDGQSIFASEMNDHTHEGVITQRDLKTGAIINEYSSGGVLPHQLRWVRNGTSLAVLNYAEGFQNHEEHGPPLAQNKRAPSSEATRRSSTGGASDRDSRAPHSALTVHDSSPLAGGSKLAILTPDSKGSWTETESRLVDKPSLYHFDWDGNTDFAFASGNYLSSSSIGNSARPQRARSSLQILAPSTAAPSDLVMSKVGKSSSTIKEFNFARAGEDGYLGEALSVAACPDQPIVAVSLPETKSLVIWNWLKDQMIQVERFSDNARGVAFLDSETLLITVGAQMLVYKPSHGRWVEHRRFPCGTGSHLTLGA